MRRSFRTQGFLGGRDPGHLVGALGWYASSLWDGENCLRWGGVASFPKTRGRGSGGRLLGAVSFGQSVEEQPWPEGRWVRVGAGGV
jgi:hypothetical protein